MSISIEIIEPALFGGVVADEIVATVSDAISDRGSCSVALCGGSTPSVLYRNLSRPPRVGEVDWSKVKIFWGDERFVPHADDQSNFRMAHETLLSNIPKPGPKVYPVDTTLKTPEDGAKAYEKIIIETCGKGNVSEVKFDLILLGIGEDGHTASIFPNSIFVSGGAVGAFSSDLGLVRAATKSDGTQRVTLTPRAIFYAERIFFITKGESKAEIIRTVIEGEEQIEKVPAQLYRHAKGKVTFFLDSGAAKNLKK